MGHATQGIPAIHANQDQRVNRRVVLKAAAALAVMTGAKGSAIFSPEATRAAGETYGYDWVESDELGAVGSASDEPIVVETRFPFTAVGAHWDGDQGTWPVVELSISYDGVDYSEPFRLEASHDLGQPTRDNRVFTGLVCATGASHIAYAVFDQEGRRTSVPGFALTYIDSSDGPALPAVGAANSDDSRPPRIVTRQEWGANESYRFDESGEWWTLRYQTVRHAIIHHSETSNVENPTEAMRAMYYYHAVTRGWRDIGYNFLVDRFGNIYQGRTGGQNVVGGHALTYSSGSCGICSIGNHSYAELSASALAGLVAITAWAVRFQNPLSRATFYDIPSLPTICGHRDVMDTLCPGEYAYDEMDTIRSLVSQTLNAAPNGPVAGLVVGDYIETSDSVNLRTSYGLSGGVIRQLGPGAHGVVDAGPVTMNGMNWYRVATDYATGWAVADFLTRRPPTDWKRGRFWRDQVVTLNDSASFRRLPTTSGTMIAGLSGGTVAQVLGGPEYADGYRWFRVRTASGDGWIAAQFLSPSGAPPPAQGPSNPGGGGRFASGDRVVVDDGPVNMRSSAGTAASIIASLATNISGTVTAGPIAASGYSWYRLSTSSGSGWVADAFLAASSGGSATGRFAVGDTITVSDGPVNLRSSAGTSASILTQLQTNASGSVVGGPQSSSGYTWYRVNANGSTGWVAQDFLSSSGGSSPPPSNSGGRFNLNDDTVVADGPLYLRSSAGSSGSILATLADGARCVIKGGPVSASGYTWYQVNSGGQTGWVASDFLAHGPRVGRTVRVFTDGGELRIRSSASTSAGVVASVNDGATGTVLAGPQSANGYTWWRIQTSAGTGWAAGAFLIPV